MTVDVGLGVVALDGEKGAVVGNATEVEKY